MFRIVFAFVFGFGFPFAFVFTFAFVFAFVFVFRFVFAFAFVGQHVFAFVFRFVFAFVFASKGQSAEFFRVDGSGSRAPPPESPHGCAAVCDPTCQDRICEEIPPQIKKQLGNN